MLPAHVLLINARLRILDPDRHTNGYLARDNKVFGTGVLPTDPTATCWCAMGAVAAEAGAVAKGPIDMFGREAGDYDYIDSKNQVRRAELPAHFAMALEVLDEAARLEWLSICETQYTGDTGDTSDIPHANYYEAYNSVLGATEDGGITYTWQMNDYAGHEFTIAVFDRAIEMLYQGWTNPKPAPTTNSVFDAHIQEA